jgi:hypothetical protein
MIIVSLSNKTNLQGKINSILDTAKQLKETAVVIMVSREDYIYTTTFFKDHKAIQKIMVGGQTFYIIREMRVELKPIDFYV